MENNKFKAEHTVDNNKPYIIRAEGTIPIVEVELEGKNGLRVMWNGSHQKCIIEMKCNDGKWRPLSGVQEVEIRISVDEQLPIIKIDQFVIPGIKEKKLLQEQETVSNIMDELSRESNVEENKPNNSKD